MPDQDVRKMNEQPGRWLARPTLEDERRLIWQFAAYGVSRALLSDATMDLLVSNFDGFVPLLVAAQRPPRGPQRSLQHWFREHASPPQSEAMREALREWLVARVTEPPMSGGMRITGPPGAVEEAIFGARLAAAEALGDWHDQQALPELRGMLGRLPERNPVLVAAIRRITDPSHADIVVIQRDSRVTLHRPISELDSMVVSSHDEITHEISTWRADHAGIENIWSSLKQGHEVGRGRPHDPPEGASFEPRRLTMYFGDGLIGSLERSGSGWMYQDNGRPHYWLEIVDPALEATIARELRRVGIAPRFPRFVRESVTLFIDPGELRVTGIYEFEGAPADGRVPLCYPIASADGLGPPRVEAIELRSATDWKLLPATLEQHGTECRIALAPGKTRAYQLEVRYRQSLAGRTAKYLITTAQEWARPLHRGWFQVIMDGSLGEPRFSLPFREQQERPGFRRFVFEASPFRPDNDLVVTW
ncbi:MAG TPA: hypothetical protein VGP61_09195 [Gemmatimonadales bacterium]|nr:hypothetical protein [Gemmatimonadales bacterium]